MPTSKVCSQCASCRHVFKRGERAVFFGHVKVINDKLEPGGVNCIHVPKEACNVSHLHTEERCVVCETCWVKIKEGFLHRDINIKDDFLKRYTYEGPERRAVKGAFCD
jgi:hypothetical protein